MLQEPLLSLVLEDLNRRLLVHKGTLRARLSVEALDLVDTRKRLAVRFNRSVADCCIVFYAAVDVLI